MPPPMARGPSAASNSPATWIGPVSLEADGSARAKADSGGRDFASGAPIRATVDVTRLPANTSVTAAWYGPDGKLLGEQTRAGRLGQERLDFAARDTGSWAPGDYRVAIRVDGQAVRSVDFRIVGEPAVRGAEAAR